MPEMSAAALIRIATDPDGCAREAAELGRKRVEAEKAIAALEEKKAEVINATTAMEAERAKLAWAERAAPVVQEQIAGLKAILAETETYLETEKSNA
jgi:hypothetical protein